MYVQMSRQTNCLCVQRSIFVYTNVRTFFSNLLEHFGYLVYAFFNELGISPLGEREHSPATIFPLSPILLLQEVYS